MVPPLLDLPPRPAFAIRAGTVLDLYARVFEDQELGINELVVCADEKTSIQARCRCHPLPPGRLGSCASSTNTTAPAPSPTSPPTTYTAPESSGRCEDTTGIVPFGRLVEQVMTVEPYKSAERVFWIVDNGSSHRGQASVDRLEGEWPTLRLIHLPVHASWLDQCEIYFSIVQRKVVNPNDFTDLDQIRQRLSAFEPRYNAVADPIRLEVHRDDLNRLLARLDDHATPAALPTAA